MTDVPAWFARLSANLGELAFEIPAERLDLLPTFDAPPRLSAVLVLFGEGASGPELLLTRRAASLRSHAGQVAFPGGRLDPGDDGPVGAALREAREETGLDPASVDVHAVGNRLSMPISNSEVVPVLAWWREPGPVAPIDPAEVAQVVRVPVAELTDPANRFTVVHPSRMLGPGFEAGGLFVWGFTAIVLTQVLDLAGLTRPWDPARRRPLDERAGVIEADRVTMPQDDDEFAGQVPE